MEGGGTPKNLLVVPAILTLVRFLKEVSRTQSGRRNGWWDGDSLIGWIRPEEEVKEPRGRIDDRVETR